MMAGAHRKGEMILPLVVNTLLLPASREREGLSMRQLRMSMHLHRRFNEREKNIETYVHRNTAVRTHMWGLRWRKKRPLCMAISNLPHPKSPSPKKTRKKFVVYGFRSPQRTTVSFHMQDASNAMWLYTRLNALGRL